MNSSDWKAIPGRLKEAGFAVLYDRISYEPKRPLWCAKASRDGREWSTLGENLCAAFLELEKQTQQAAGNWRKTIVGETRACGTDERSVVRDSSIAKHKKLEAVLGNPLILLAERSNEP